MHLTVLEEALITAFRKLTEVDKGELLKVAQEWANLTKHLKRRKI